MTPYTHVIVSQLPGKYYNNTNNTTFCWKWCVDVLTSTLLSNHSKLTLCPDWQYFGHNFDKFKYIVVYFCKEYHEGDAKLLTPQKSDSSNQCRYFTLQIRQSPSTAKHKVITYNCNIVCEAVTSSCNSRLPSVSNMRYVGVHFVKSRTLKCSLDAVKRWFLSRSKQHFR